MPGIAYFIMVHHKPAQFDWLMRAIDHPDDRFLIHVDLKSRLGLKADRKGVWRDVRRIADARANARMMRSRFTNWGGWSLSKILLDAIRLALRDPGWSHFVNLSGQCYPLQPLDRLRAEIAASDRLHVEMRRIDATPPDDWHRNWHPMLETPVKAMILKGRKPPPTSFALDHKGSQWVVLPRDFCEWLATAPVTRVVSAYLSGLLLSDELVMQALAWNGPFRDRIADDYRREIVWPGPKTFTGADLPRLQASRAWFGRKFDAAADPGLMPRLAADLGYPAP